VAAGFVFSLADWKHFSTGGEGWLWTVPAMAGAALLGYVSVKAIIKEVAAFVGRPPVTTAPVKPAEATPESSEPGTIWVVCEGEESSMGLLKSWGMDAPLPVEAIPDSMTRAEKRKRYLALIESINREGYPSSAFEKVEAEIAHLRSLLPAGEETPFMAASLVEKDGAEPEGAKPEKN
jgi:hypothetical protein